MARKQPPEPTPPPPYGHNPTFRDPEQWQQPGYGAQPPYQGPPTGQYPQQGYYPPQQPYYPQPQPQVVYVQQPAQQSSGGCFKAIGVAVVLFVGLIVFVIVVTALGASQSPTTTARSGAGPSGPTATKAPKATFLAPGPDTDEDDTRAVKMASCVTDSFGFVHAKGQIFNKSDSSRLFRVSVELVDANKVKVGDAFTVLSLSSGQAGAFEAVSTTSYKFTTCSWKVSD